MAKSWTELKAEENEIIKRQTPKVLAAEYDKGYREGKQVGEEEASEEGYNDGYSTCMDEIAEPYERALRNIYDLTEKSYLTDQEIIAKIAEEVEDVFGWKPKVEVPKDIKALWIK